MLVEGGTAWIRRRRSPTALARGELPLHIAQCNTFQMMTQRPTVLVRGGPVGGFTAVRFVLETLFALLQAFIVSGKSRRASAKLSLRVLWRCVPRMALAGEIRCREFKGAMRVLRARACSHAYTARLMILELCLLLRALSSPFIALLRLMR